jgi:hypothetical protein
MDEPQKQSVTLSKDEGAELYLFHNGGCHLSYIDHSGYRRVEAFEKPDDVVRKLDKLKDMRIKRLTLKGSPSTVELFASFEAVKAFPLLKDTSKEEDEPWYYAFGYSKTI